ncbi:MAG: DUF1549 domain-containing protein [Planctomycetaceae bacterium]|nr:DUF1549 domain-containing protein [Planctomycetaceae bacterium]
MRIFLFCLLLVPVPLQAEEPPFFETDIRPILKAACFHCHGEEAIIEGNLDLRLRRLIRQGGDSGPALIPDSPEKSLIWQRIESNEMPPGDAQLTTAEKALIRRWISTGARTVRPEPEDQTADAFTLEEKNFWSLLPIREPNIPIVQDPSRIRTPIDAFVLARLEHQGLTFAPEADKRTLIRRLYFDLIGLPPTPEEIEKFLADREPGAYERVVDHLLESPHYGERWGRHWLDVAGYADSEGFTESDPERPAAFRYRDYVIQAFNADKPFDQFIQEQLAGDEMIDGPLKNLSEENIEKLTATGFLRMAPDGTGEGGVDQNLARNQVISESLKIVTTSLMGLTVGCAECHNHRYDPIRQTDYYSMRAIFEPAYDWKKWRAPRARLISLYTDEDRRIAAEIEAQAKAVDEERNELAKTFIAQTLESQLLKLPQDVREPLRMAYNTPAGERSEEQQNLLDKYPKILKISAGSLYLYDREIRADAAKLDQERKQKEAQYVAEALTAALSDLSDSEQTAIRTAQQTAAASRSAEQKELLEQYADRLVTSQNLKDFAPKRAAELQALADARKELLATQKADRLKELQDRATEIRNTKPKEGFVRALSEIPGQVPQTFLFERGNYDQPKELLEPAGLSVLKDLSLVSIPVNDGELPTSGRRLAFARRLTDGQHPLTARVLVNRFWLHHFGRGIVETPGDFGYLGSRPTHPELLDWLASKFMSNGWRLKPLHRLMVTSSIYRQSSQRHPKQDEIDPDNRLYGRMSIQRLDAEAVRDAILAVSGKLNRKMYGEPVPVMEDIVGQIVIGKENLDGERKPLAAIDMQGEEYRRSIYIQVRRSRPLAVLSTFDLPQMEPNCTVRNSSTVTPQALMLMNSRFASDYAELLAQRLREIAGDDAARQIRTAWNLVFGQVATEAQITNSIEFLQKQENLYQQHPPEDTKLPPAELALNSFCQALLSSNQFLYVD